MSSRRDVFLCLCGNKTLPVNYWKFKDVLWCWSASFERRTLSLQWLANCADVISADCAFSSSRRDFLLQVLFLKSQANQMKMHDSLFSKHRYVYTTRTSTAELCAPFQQFNAKAIWNCWLRYLRASPIQTRYQYENATQHQTPTESEKSILTNLRSYLAREKFLKISPSRTLLHLEIGTAFPVFCTGTTLTYKDERQEKAAHKRKLLPLLLFTPDLNLKHTVIHIFLLRLKLQTLPLSSRELTRSSLADKNTSCEQCEQQRKD